MKMKMMLALTAILAGLLFFTACDNAKKTVLTSPSGRPDRLPAVADQANQYVPDQAKDVQTSIQSARRL